MKLVIIVLFLVSVFSCSTKKDTEHSKYSSLVDYQEEEGSNEDVDSSNSVQDASKPSVKTSGIEQSAGFFAIDDGISSSNSGQDNYSNDLAVTNYANIVSRNKLNEYTNTIIEESVKIFYFGFDQKEYSKKYFKDLERHAEFIINRPNIHMVLYGHTDEVGSPEYNMALGELRAKSVLQVLLALGVNENQIKVVSYGEIKPLAIGHAEKFWSKNRRVIIEYFYNE